MFLLDFLKYLIVLMPSKILSQTLDEEFMMECYFFNTFLVFFINIAKLKDHEKETYNIYF